MWKPLTYVVVLLVAAVGIQTAAGSSAKPTLLLTHRSSPVRVSGTSFSRAEPLDITVRAAGKTETRHLVTSATGTFTASFDLTVDPCLAGTTVIARRAGRAVALAQLKIPARACAPAP